MHYDEALLALVTSIVGPAIDVDESIVQNDPETKFMVDWYGERYELQALVVKVRKKVREDELR